LTLAVLAVVALAGALRLAWVIYAKTEPLWFFDPWNYDRLAAALADGKGYVNEAGQPTAYYPPGYPAVLGAVYWLVGHRPVAGEVLNVVLGALTAGLVYWIGSRAFGRAAGLVAALAFAVFPSHILYASQLHSEVVFTAAYLLVLGFLLTAPQPLRLGGRHVPFWLAAGLAIGAAGLIRPAALSLLVVVPFAMRPRGVPWAAMARGTLLVALAAGLVLIPWVARNAARVGVAAISTNAGLDFWIGNHEGAAGGWGMPTAEAFPRISTDLQVQERHDYHRGLELGWRFIRERPLDALALLPSKAYHLYADDAEAVTTTETWGHTVFLSDGGRRVLRGLTDGFYYFVLAGAVAGLLLPPAAARGQWRRWHMPRRLWAGWFGDDPKRPTGEAVAQLVGQAFQPGPGGSAEAGKPRLQDSTTSSEGGNGESVTWQQSCGHLPLVAALAGWTLIHLLYFGEPRFHLPATPIMVVMAAPAWLWAAGLLQRPILSKWRAFRPPAASRVDRAEAL
jgi:4-amino-4-deoxy-L-arabinose transferase-like glycosyltransferase